MMMLSVVAESLVMINVKYKFYKIATQVIQDI